MIKKRKTMVLLCVVCTFLLTGCAGKMDKGIEHLEKKSTKKQLKILIKQLKKESRLRMHIMDRELLIGN